VGLTRARQRFSGAVSVIAAVGIGAASGLLGVCGPFSDTVADAFCPSVLEIFTLGITTGTTPKSSQALPPPECASHPIGASVGKSWNRNP